MGKIKSILAYTNLPVIAVMGIGYLAVGVGYVFGSLFGNVIDYSKEYHHEITNLGKEKKEEPRTEVLWRNYEHFKPAKRRR